MLTCVSRPDTVAVLSVPVQLHTWTTSLHPPMTPTDDRHPDLHTQTDKQRIKQQTARRKHRHPDRQKHMQTHIEINRQIGRHTHTHRHRQTDSIAMDHHSNITALDCH